MSLCSLLCDLLKAKIRSILLCLCIIIVLLAWLFNPFYPDRGYPPEKSYDHRITFNLDDVRRPKTHKEIVTIIKEAYSSNKKVRVLAAGHSWSEIAQTEDIMISLDQYSGLTHVDTDGLQVTVKAGTQLRDLSELLDKQGLAMINLGSVAAQSLGGAVSTATHGTGLTVGNLAALVTKLKFVSGKDGETITLSEEDEDPSQFRAAAVSIGLFGVLSEITIRVTEAFDLREIRTPHTLDDCLNNLTHYVEGNTYVKMWVEFYNDFCALYQTEKATNCPNTGNPGRVESFLTYYSFAISTRVTYLFPSLTSIMMKLVNYVGLTPEVDRVDKSYLIFNDFFDLPIHQESEIVVPYEDSVKLVKTIRKVVRDNGHPVNYITEVRFVKGDSNHLSPHYNMSNGACAVTLTIYGHPETVEEYFDAVYDATRIFEGRIHWGKHFSRANSTDFQSWFEHYEAFKELRKEYDPKDIFVNEFIEEKFDFITDN